MIFVYAAVGAGAGDEPGFSRDIWVLAIAPGKVYVHQGSTKHAASGIRAASGGTMGYEDLKRDERARYDEYCKLRSISGWTGFTHAQRSYRGLPLTSASNPSDDQPPDETRRIAAEDEAALDADAVEERLVQSHDAIDDPAEERGS